MKFSKTTRFLTALIVGAALAACGTDAGTDGVATGVVNPTGWPIVDEPITMSMMGPGVGLEDWENMPFFTYLNEATNVNWEFTTPPQGDFATHLNLAFNTGNLPDVIFGGGVSAAQQIDFGSQGIILPLQDLIAEYAPNLTALLDANPEIRSNITAPDGNIYAIPRVVRGVESYWMAGPLWFNGEWLEALDAEVPTTLDEFTALMFRFRDEMPAILGVDQVFPISDGGAMVWVRNWFLSAFGITTRAQEVVDGVVHYGSMTDNYRAYLEWMNMAYNEGLLHPEIFTMSPEANSALGQNGQVGFFQSWYSMFFLGHTDEQGLSNPMFHPLTSEWSPTPVIPLSPRMSAGTFVLSADNPNPAAAVRWIDFFFSEEGAKFSFFGPEGAYYDLATNDAGEEVMVYSANRDLDDVDFRGRVTPFFNFPAPHLLMDFPPVLHDANDEPNFDFRNFLEQETQTKIVPYGRVPFPPTMLSQEEADQLAIINADLLGFLDQQEALFITASEPITDAQWAEFLATQEQIGVQTIIDVFQAAYDRRPDSSNR